MKKFIRGFILFLFPSFLSMPFLRLFGCKVRGRVGFSWIMTEKLSLEKGVHIGHLNFINIRELDMKKGSVIKKCNVFNGGIKMRMKEGSEVYQFNKVTAPKTSHSIFSLGISSVIATSHLFDLTSNLWIGDYSKFAGAGTQVWTHGTYHSKFPPKRWFINGEVRIGENVNISTRCIITAGISICDNATIGAGVVVSKDIQEPLLFVNQPLRVLSFDPDVAILRYSKINEDVYEKRHL